MKQVSKILAVTCKNCGSAIGFDIPSQSYRCSYCGAASSEKTATEGWKISGADTEATALLAKEEIICPACGGNAKFHKERNAFICPWCETETPCGETEGPEWKVLQENNWQQVQRENEIGICTGCGAKVLFQKDEASESCSFCGGNLIRNALMDTEELPELVIPYVLTETEAKERLWNWVKSQKDTKDARRVKQNIEGLKGYYLPYRLIRGPIKGVAYRDKESREFYFHGFLDHAVVNCSQQLDNQVLDVAEPFDLSKLQPFAPAYVGGHRVKLSDVPQGEVKVRSLEEAKDNYRPYIAKALHNDDVEIKMDAEELRYLPILLPMYVLKVGKYLAVVNGQTGRVAVESSKKMKSSKRWILEPTILLVISILLTAWLSHGNLQLIITMGTIALIVFFSIYSEGKNNVLHRTIFAGRKSTAERKDGKLVLEEGEDVLKNPFENAPYFYEKEHGHKIPVTMEFYAPDRMFFVILKLIFFIFLPGILAILINHEIRGLHFEYGAAWYILASAYSIVYATRGLRWDIFNHPILYEILPDGNKRLIGNRKSRRLSILSTFGLDTKEKRKELGGIWYFILGFLIFILLGSTMAIIF